MRGHLEDNAELADFVVARTAELHRAAYLLTADQDRAERLVALVIGELARRGADLARAGSDARRAMARMAAAVSERPPPELAPEQAPLATLSPRERAVLMLRSLDGYDVKSTARALQLKKASVRAAEETSCESLGFEVDNPACRCALTEFADQATWPDPDVTMCDAATARRPHALRLRYVAVAAVLALTAAAPIDSQVQHDGWLRTPDGINASHGTHFPAYTQGYQLVAVDEVVPGSAQTVHAGENGALVIPCTRQLQVTIHSRYFDSEGGCSDQLTQVWGETTITLGDLSRTHWPVAVYRPVPWDEYPVATTGFVVEHDRTLRMIRQLSTDDGHVVRPVTSGTVLTLHGSRDRPNGTFTAQLVVPSGPSSALVDLSGLLSPTSSGRYSLLVDNIWSFSDCGFEGGSFSSSQHSGALTCSIFDRHVPQIVVSEMNATPGSRVVPVEFTVRGTRGPWTLQLVFDRYRLGADGQPVSP